MKIVMLSVYDNGKKIVLNPGDVTDVFDDAEALRIVSVGGARLQTGDEIRADQDAAAAAAEKAAAEKAAAEKAAGKGSNPT